MLPDKLGPFLWQVTNKPYYLGFYALCGVSHFFAHGCILAFSFILAKFIDSIRDEDSMSLLYFLVALVGIQLCRGTFSALGLYFYAHMTPKFSQYVRRELFNHLLSHPISYFEDRRVGALAHKITEVPTAIIYLYSDIIYIILPIIALALFGIGFIIFIDPVLAMIFILWLLVFSAMAVWCGIRCSRLNHKMSTAAGNMLGTIADSLTNIHSMRLFTGRAYELDQYEQKADINRHWIKKVLDFKIIMDILSAVMLPLFIALIAGYALYAFNADAISAGDLVMAITISFMMANRADDLAHGIYEISNYIGIAKEGVEHLNANYPDRNGPIEAIRIDKGAEISLDKLSFFYNDDKQIFENLSLTVEAGQRIGLVGPSGAGKTSLVSLLLRFYEPTGGKIKINEHNVEEMTLDALRQNIAVIPQDTSLFHRSLMDNIRYGRLYATDEEVIEAAKKAHAHGFISELPDGYETLVGERGVKLSGGQRQRIAIARAILKDAPILILDEATSALDSESERLIQDSLKELMEGKTVIAIAHRLSTINHLDRLIVMDQGHIVEDGTHDQLLEQNGLYSKLWSMQSGGFLGE